jgi:transcriptional regulator with XRE-family HTH domain
MRGEEGNTTKIIGRLKEFLDKRGDTMASLVRELGVSRSYFSTTRRAGAELGSDKIVRILQLYPDLSPEWLLLGNGLMIKNASLSNLNELLERDKKLREVQQDLAKMREYLDGLQAKIAQVQVKKIKSKS